MTRGCLAMLRRVVTADGAVTGMGECNFAGMSAGRVQPEAAARQNRHHGRLGRWAGRAPGKWLAQYPGHATIAGGRRAQLDAAAHDATAVVTLL